MILERNPDPRVDDIARILAKNTNDRLGLDWIKKRYNVTTNEASSLLVMARAELRNFWPRYFPVETAWERETIPPDEHRFIPKNLYVEQQTVTFTIIKQSKIND